MTPILTYGPNDNAPTGMRYAAAMVPDGKPGSCWMATGPTEEAARAKLEAMWQKEHPSPRPGPKKGSQPAVVVDEDEAVL